MRLSALIVVGFCILLNRGIYGNHFLGGTITWRPLNHSATGSPVAIVITQTYVFNYTAMQCTNAMIMSNSFVPNYFFVLASEKLECVRNCGSGAVGYTNISVIPRCTDYSVPAVSIVGQRSDTVYLQSGSDFSVSFMSGYWRSLATVTSGNWTISSRINVTPRPDNGLYNNAPVATMMSPINLPFNKTVAIHIPVADADGDTVRCRWANKSNGADECGDVCPPASLPPNTILLPNCTIIITGKNISDAYAVAVVVEDFINSTSTTPLSSVPVQFLVEVVSSPSCTIPPEMVGIPPEGSCTPVIVGQTYSSELIAINHCGASVVISDIATLSFAGVIQSNITKQNTTTFHKLFTWTPTAAQLGYQVMCAMAVDSQDVQSSQYCFNFYVSANSTTDCPGKVSLTTYISTTSSTTTTTETTSSTSTSTSSTTTSTTSTTDTTSTSSTTSITSVSTSSTTSTTTSTSSSSSSTSSSSTSTTSTSTSSTSSTSTTASTVITTITSKQKPFDWPLFGTIIGLLLLATLALCCCFCWCYLWPLVAVSSEYRNDNKPVLYHIEPCFDPDCRGWDRSSPSDVPLGHYMNLERILSETSTNKMLNSSINPSEMTLSISRRDWSSFVSSGTSSHVPLVDVSVSRVSMIEREGTFGNARIKPPIHEVINKQNYFSRRRQVNTGVIVSRIKSSHNQKISPDISRDHLSTSEYPSNRDHVKVTRVHSALLDTSRQSILNQPLKFAFTDNEEPKPISPLSINSGHRSHFDYLLSSSDGMNQIKRSLETLPMKSKRISAKNPIRVDRISKRKDKRQHSNSLSSITTSKQKRKTDRHGTTRVERISLQLPQS